ncbi:MAG: hypothetical protein J6Y72_00925 [Bacteroidales bacterium]|nr:hypothetical protein [Bacteroidales bacterium]MCR5695697.1 hypothetical protein [Marinilabiliaceae bacterium]
MNTTLPQARVFIITTIFVLMSTMCAFAQKKAAPEQVECWKILKYRQSTWAMDKALPADGMMYITNNYIEIDCYQIRLYLRIVKMNKYSSNYYSIDVEDYDEFYNHVEVRQAFGTPNKKDLYVIIGQQDDEGNMHSSIILTCRSMTASPNRAKKPNSARK